MAEDHAMEMDIPSTPSPETTIETPLTPSPLHLDLRHQAALFLSDLGLSQFTDSPPITIPRIIFDYATGREVQGATSQLLGALSSLAADEGVSGFVLARFQPVILDLLARWLEDAAFTDQVVLEKRLLVLSSVTETNPELWSLITAFILKSPFRSSPLSVVPEDHLRSGTEDRLHCLLLAYLRLLTADPQIASRNNWPVAPLHTLRTEHPDKGVRLLAIQVLARQQGWGEEKRMAMEKEWVGDVESVDAEVVVGWEVVPRPGGVLEIWPIRVDGWMLPVVEARRVEKTRQLAADYTYSPTPTLSSSDLASRSTIVADSIVLRASLPDPRYTTLHVPTTPTDTTLRSLLPLVQRTIPILLTSPPSSGKTHILHYFSSMLFPSQQPTSRILTIPLADTSIDVKSLIGTYVSSPTKPGTFEWMEGALAKAIRAGRWVVFEDVDRGSTEMLVTLAGIARSLKVGRPGRRARLAVPGREDVEAGDGFALFATRTTRQGYAAPVFFGHHIFSEVLLDAPSDDDILSILTARFQRLPQSVLTTLVSIWHQLRPFDKLSGQVKARDIGLRDLEKWCARVDRNLPPSASLAALEQSSSGVFANTVLQDEVFLEGVDIFVASLDTKGVSLEKRAQMISVIAKGLGMDEDRTAALDGRRPNFELSPGSRQLHVGRVVMDITAPEKGRREVAPASRPFALTKPSLVLLERIAVSLALGEPTLLVGETGTGKTTAVQHIASIVRKPLTVLNLSMQTESSDLLGGFKPIDASIAARNLQAKWQKLFCDTFSMGKPANGAYVEAAARAMSGRKWARCAELWASSARRAIDKLGKGEPDAPAVEGSPLKRRKITKATRVAVEWQALLVEITDFDLHHAKMKSKLVFSFVEGPLVKAIKILLDEVNLASQETLEAISTILEGPTASLVLTERGDVEPIARHPEFRLFACMNPATDVGKKDLPPNLRARFTELYVPPPDDDREALIAIVSQYLGDAAAGDKGVILDVAELYTTLKKLSTAKEIVDGSNAPPHFSMRTLARALMFAVESAPVFGLRRGLWEGYLMAFTMSLDAPSARIAHEAGEKFILAPMKNARAVLAQIPTLPASMDPDDFVRFGPFWLKRGPLPPTPESRYIITASVQSKLSDLARVILTKRYPVLIQGPTSAGKTSAVEFLARQTGHRFVRINNHEHTDIQEYLGTYVTDPQTGNLVFQEGLLVTAVKQGHWIVLDELNLAPTDVLEALNRLLDDNRELVIPETQEVIKPHPNFILFATQNPPGLYAGRKILSRAFRNRFLEVHFDDVPKGELETILCQRCQIAPSYAKKIVQVFEELRHRRQASRVFESKQSFATLRDLFRWAERGAVGYQQLGEDGYMLLAERARQDEDKVVIKQVIEQVLKITIDEDNMYGLFDKASGILSRFPQTSLPPTSMVWTKAMQRLFALVAAALIHNEPVLLVGETGCGKTSVCEVVAHMFGQALVGVNCHQNMETADLLGSQRPVRNRLERRAKIIGALSQYAQLSATATEEEMLELCAALAKREDVDKQVIAQCQREVKQLSALFEWSDGPLVHAMAAGDLLLLDEVSLADDSVLERLNSVLEPGRTLVLAEKGGVDIDEATIVANERFHVVATMNPGGDFGKKELSPALRNRFTEIWVPALNNRDDLLQIIGQSMKHEELRASGPAILDFFLWFGERLGDASGLGLRDVLAWVSFSNDMFAKGLTAPQAFHHGGQMVLIDGLESLPQVSGLSTVSVNSLRHDCLIQLDAFAATLGGGATTTPELGVEIGPDSVAIGGFAIPRGPVISEDATFRFEAPTTALNAMRLVRGCQLPKAILLEGSPGVGKTSLVNALAGLSGHHLQRINLSDQTDLIDLFGSDLPVEGGAPGEFQWRDAAFLDAMQKGDWVLLDEMNLASQTVLEGLNAVLDHRGTVYIPELGKSFDRHPDFRVFAAQNPLQQGGGRKGLPKSFLNRFTKVYLQEHTAEDLMIICRDLHPMPVDIVENMIAFNEVMRVQTMITRAIGREGSPWEFNLRDLFRWFSLLKQPNGLEKTDHPAEYFLMVYRQRFRSERDRQAVTDIFEGIFGCKVDVTRPASSITPSWLQVGHSLIRRGGVSAVDVHLQHQHLAIAQSVLKGIELGWLIILAGDSGVGKRALVRGLAEGAGRELGQFAMHPGVDTSEILGSFEQQDVGRLLDAAARAVTNLVTRVSDDHPSITARLAELASARQLCKNTADSAAVTFFTQLCESIIAQLASLIDVTLAQQALASLVKAGPNASGFAWVDGQLIHAIKNGGWFLISDANLCSASVLDRLNSLCETNGMLVLSEKGSSTGSPEVLKPHKDFRLFMTYDPRFGELSRAMRNRGVELYVGGGVKAAPSSLSLADQSLLRQATLLDVTSSTEVEHGCASAVANSVSLQSQASLPLLARFGRSTDALYAVAGELLKDESLQQIVKGQSLRAALGQHFDGDLVSALPIDPTLNLNIHSDEQNAAAVFTILQILLRNDARRGQVQAWLGEGVNAKSVLALSVAAAKRGPSRMKQQAGNDVYPFTSAFREVLRQQLSTAVLTESGVLERMERILVYVELIEEHAKEVAFDYSSTKLLAGWLDQELEGVTLLAPVLEKLQSLAKTVQLTTGMGQAQVWMLFRDAKRDLEAVAVVRRLSQLADGVRDPELRGSLLQALASISDNASSEEAIAELETLIVTTKKEGREETGDDVHWANWTVLACLELAVLQGAGARDAFKVILNDRHVNISSLLSLQRDLDASVPPAVVFEAMSGWMQRVWDHAGSTEEYLTGPADLFKPVKLEAVLRFGVVETVKLSEIPEQDDALRFSHQAALWGAKESESRREGTLKLAVACIGLVLSAFGVSTAGNEQSSVEEMAQVLSDKLHTEDESSYLRAPLTRVASALTTVLAQPHDLYNLGGLWLAISRLLLDLYVTNIPIDPGVRRTLQGEVIETRVAMVKEELVAVERAEVVVKGVSDSKRAAGIQQRVASLEADRDALGPALERQSDALRLSYLFSEVHAFLADPYSESRVSQLVNALEMDHPQAFARERDFQLASAAFVQRLNANYSDMSDLVQPILTAVLFGKFGVRCLARGVELRGVTQDPTISLAVSFPLAQGVRKLQRLANNAPVDKATGVPTDLLAASAHLCELETKQQRAAHLPGLSQRLDHLYQTWSAIRLREQQEAQDSESLYRVRKTDIHVLSEQEEEEKEFAELFPQYEDAGTEDAMPTKGGAAGEKEEKKGFLPSYVASFTALIKHVFGKGHSTPAALLKGLVDEALHASFRATDFDESLDVTSLAFQISTLHHRQSEVRTSPVQPNFYLSPNEPEVRKAHDLLVRLVARLDLLIDEWSEQMVLVHIRERCERILALDARSPVAKILSALELLLLHTEDWEAYAHRENSLASFRDETSRLIIEWRKLELASWMRLLEDQAEMYRAEDNEWTLRLYGGIIHGAVGAPDISKHIEEVLPMVSTYINSSSFGRFTSRLDMLACLQRMATEMSGDSANLAAIATMLHNVLTNARLFEPRISDSMSSQRAVIDKAIKDFVRLASWKDVNVFALKASAQKSHKALHRSIRKFRDVLRQPVSPIMGELNGIVPQEAAVLMEQATPTVYEISALVADVVEARKQAGGKLPDVLARLDETFGRYSLVHTKLQSSISDSTASLVDSMTVDIIETAADLAKQTPSTLTKENEKVVNNLASRKRKAYSDLLKALRASGFSNSVRADQLKRQQSVTWLASQQPVSVEGLPDGFDKEGARKIEGYHHRLEVLMSALRAAFNGHNPDIASQDLERGIGFVESVYAGALNERSRVVSNTQSLAKLACLLDRITLCAKSASVTGGAPVFDALKAAESSASQIHSALREVEDGIRQLRELQGRQVQAIDLEAVHELRQETTLLVQALSLALNSAKDAECLLFTQDEHSLFAAAGRIKAKLIDRFSAQANTSPEFRHLLHPVIDMVRTSPLPPLSDFSTSTSDMWTKSDEIIQSLLVVAQQMKAPNTAEVKEDEYPHIPTDFKEQRALTSSLHVGDVLGRLHAFARTLASAPAGAIPACLARVIPFLQVFAQTYAQSVSTHIQTVKATYKLSYVVGRVVLDLAQKGFCKPQEEGDGGDGADGEMVEGTGMGQGTGEKDVSKEIKEESQVEGLQGEEEDKDEDKGGEEDDAFSMDEDFEGDMGEGKEKEEGSGDEEEEEEDHDEQVGDVDPLDPGAVDEKFWGDEEKEENNKDSDELMDQKAEEQEGESEMAAKENDKKEIGEKEEKKDKEEAQEGEQGEQKPEDDKGGDEGEELDQEEEEVLGEERNEEGDEQPAGQDQQEVAVPEGETLDLPEDLNFDEEEGEEGEGEDDKLDDDMGMSVDGEEEEHEGGEPDQIDGTNEEEGEAMEEAPPATGEGEDETEEEAQMAQDADLGAANEQTQESEVGKGVTSGIEGEKKEKESDEKEDVEKDDAEAQAQGKDGVAPQAQENMGDSSDQPQADGPTDSTGAPLPANDNAPPQTSRSLGDILKEIRRRHDEIRAQEESETEQPSEDQQAPQEAAGQVEYVKEDEAKEDDQQALGAAGDEERQKLEDLKIVEEEEQEGPNTRPAFEDEEMEGDEDEEQREQREKEGAHQTRGEADGEREQAEKALTQADIGGRPTGDAPDDAMDVDAEDLEGGVEANELPIDEEDGDEPELNIVDPAPVAGTLATADDLWRRYASMTSDLSYALCEQLRLILEPTLATRLQGDFRTGKRLNMRKIIPYIASEYTKDKIWLRRTKPSRREYQVLLSLDDSRSMSESHSVDLAYQTLALVSQAMNKLEVGQVSIAKFGEAVDILHPFKEGGFTDADGAKVMSSFKFDQHKTDVASLVERTLTYLGEARSGPAMSASAPDLWQLQIIISDGVCQDHAKLRRLLRRALEERVMIVFIIVDSLHQTVTPSAAANPAAAAASRPSILSMQTVEYKNVGGEMKLEMQRYLDTFPFEFYVVLRDVEALPGVLADTLRQWMTRVSQSQE
ncbi:hypothetical protein IAT38_005281 [Cryptococcus sp. DSM 104549]